MRTRSTLIALGLLAGSGSAGTVVGDYDVKLEETASTCDPKPESFNKSSVHLTVAKNELTVKFATLYKMVGTVGKDGQLDAKTTKIIGTSIAGLSARYSIVGHAVDGKLDLVLTAQYIRQDNNRPHCAQAWTVSGTRR